jgi:hypothetical protein
MTPKDKATFVGYAKPFKAVQHLALPDGIQVTGGFDRKVSWQIRTGRASIDKETPVESDRRDSDLQYAFHQPDYFEKFEFAGVTDFDGRSCYHLHGPRIGARTTISFTMSKPDCLRAIVSRRIKGIRRQSSRCFRITRASADPRLQPSS